MKRWLNFLFVENSQRIEIEEFLLKEKAVGAKTRK